MRTHPFGYITIIVVQQLVIVGLFFGVAQLLRELDRLRRGAKIWNVVENADLSPGEHQLANSQPPQLPSKLARKLAGARAVEHGACILTGVES